MCRNIKPLFNFAPPATDDDIRAAALQFVRKIADTRKPSKQNQAAFDRAIEEIFRASKTMLDELVPTTPPKSRETWEEVRRMKFKKRDERRASGA
jgi:hypothetical protein